MRIKTLQGIFERQLHVKLFVVTDKFCLCGYASNPQATERGLLVDIGPSIRVSFQSKELLHEPVASGTLHLTSACKVTRRLQTHQRHLAGKGVSDQYMDLALAL